MMSVLALLIACGPAPEDIAGNLSSANPVTREDTAKIARNFGSPEVEAALIESLQDPTQKVRYNALESLIEMETVAAVPAIMAMLEVESDREVEQLAVDALGRMGDPQAVPTLIAYIETCRDDGVRSIPLNAIWALGFIGDGRALPLLSELREDSDIYISWNADQALKKLRP
ncbi:MAG: HEAT repeat protein [Myxococcota bacterium]|jgi:HEAT repeat protein